MDRRDFMAALGGLFLPYEPKRIYSFPTPKVGLPDEFFDATSAALKEQPTTEDFSKVMDALREVYTAETYFAALPLLRYDQFSAPKPLPKPLTLLERIAARRKR